MSTPTSAEHVVSRPKPTNEPTNHVFGGDGDDENPTQAVRLS